jgi:CMP-N-acetylneuraminic acid synthetase
MLDGKTFLAIIPARGGSKRLPKKNILPLAGKPLITWTIEAAKKSNYIDEIVVSSDDDKILEIAQNHSLKTLKRTKKLASDTATSIDVVKNIITHYPSYDFIILLQPTSPFRTNQHIDEAIETLINKQADAIISVCETEHSPLWSTTLENDNRMNNFLDQNLLNMRSQDLKTFYRLNGAIYIADTKKLLAQNTFFLENNIFAYIMQQNESVDIDTQLDFDFANFLMQGK